MRKLIAAVALFGLLGCWSERPKPTPTPWPSPKSAEIAAIQQSQAIALPVIEPVYAPWYWDTAPPSRTIERHYYHPVAPDVPSRWWSTPSRPGAPTYTAPAPSRPTYSRPTYSRPPNYSRPSYSRPSYSGKRR